MILRDQPERWRVIAHDVLASGQVSSFVTDEVVTPSGQVMHRQYLTHPGAVAIVAWDDEDQITVVNQYRHPVAHRLVEIPAGLLDHRDEDPLEAAQRELAEEASLAASYWRVLVDIFSTPGGCAEGLRVFLARDLAPAPQPAGFVVEDEEAHMESYRLPREQLLAGIYAGELSCPSLVSGVLALENARLSGLLDKLRPPNSPWPARAELSDRL